MAINPPKRQAPKPKISVIQWLLDSDLRSAPLEMIVGERVIMRKNEWVG